MEEAQEKSKPYELSARQKAYLKWKRRMDWALSGAAIVVLSPVLGMISLLIKVESPGPVLFKQKRVGKDQELFEIWKFRSMRSDTPKDVPTHMLSDPDRYITKIGKFLRKTSLDELPQFFNIFRGQMSVIGPRPALWNQENLIAEREKYGANQVLPGLTGWAQINGRDELEIPVKAQLDGEYVEHMGFGMDLKCFLGTIGSVLTLDGVVEGGTGTMEKVDGAKRAVVEKEKLNREIRIGAAVVVSAFCAFVGMAAWMKRQIQARKQTRTRQGEKKKSKKLMFVASGLAAFAALYRRSQCRQEIYRQLLSSSQSKEKGEDDAISPEDEKPVRRVLITGAGSYLGMAVEARLGREPEHYQVDTLDMVSDDWRDTDFSAYDVVYHVAGIAHADVGEVSEKQKALYYRVNTDLAVETAEKAKREGVRQFIFMSSMIVYSGCREKTIGPDTLPKPLNFYGDSKWQADQKIRDLADENFHVVVLRPPMIYGKGCKGNYPMLSQLAGKLPVFPEVKNQRSMLYIENLCEFVKLMIDQEESGVFFPQNREYTNTSEMVQMIATVKGHRLMLIPGMTAVIKLLQKFPGKMGALAEKGFGDLAYEMGMSEYKEEYRVCTLLESIQRTEEG